MKVLQKLGFLAAACALLVATFSIIGPRAVRAAVATLVQVVNTTANPVITSRMDDPGRIPYQSIANPECTAAAVSCIFSFSAVPAGHRLVVQHVMGSLLLNSAASRLSAIALLYPTSGPVVRIASVNGLQLTGVSTINDFDQSVLFYVDASQQVSWTVSVAGTTFFGPGSTVTMVGYLLDCVAGPCAPIAD
jgi:hypothetical protein